MNRGNLILSGMTPAIAFIGGAYLANWLALWPLGLKNAPLGKTPRAIDITSIRKRPTTLNVDIPSREAGRVRSGARIWRVLRSPSESERIHGRGPCGIDEEPGPDMRMSIEAEGARPSSLVAVRRAQADPLYDLDLKRQVELANAQTVRELGPFPAGGIPMQIKRRPVVPERAPGAEKSREEQPFQEGEQMNLMKMAATAALAATALAGCGRADDYKKVRYEHNPDPRERYEITVTVQGAPGPLNVAEGGAWYDIANRTCLPQKDSYTGADVVASSAGREITLTPTGEGTWTGTVYADGMREAPYFGAEVCTWRFGGVGIQIKATGAQEETRFKPSMDAGQIRREETVVTYFNKSGYPSSKRIENSPYFGQSDRSRFGPAVTDADLFTITVRSRKVAS